MITLESPLISTETLESMLGSPGLRILDCSMVLEPDESGAFRFASGRPAWEDAHIPGSSFISVPEELSDPDHALPFMMPSLDYVATSLKAHGIADGCAVVLYDRGNHAWAARAWWVLRACGFDNAAVLNGGWSAWTREGRPVDKDAQPLPAATALTLTPRAGLFVNKQQVLDAIEDPSVLLVHSLSLPHFKGEVCAYPRAGRITGSCNMFCESLLDADSKTYFPAEQIRERVRDIGALEADRVITYCGGGIAASSNALALTVAGLTNVAVYDGSLSEWTADPDTPMEIG